MPRKVCIEAELFDTQPSDGSSLRHCGKIDVKYRIKAFGAGESRRQRAFVVPYFSDESCC
jgi:hypothetical protein